MKSGNVAQIELIDQSGKVLLSQILSNLNGTYSFDVSRLSAGSYMVVLKADGAVIKTESVSVTK